LKKDEDIEGKVESISVDENDHIIQSSRKEWEEDLGASQQLGVSQSSGHKINKFNTF